MSPTRLIPVRKIAVMAWGVWTMFVVAHLPLAAAATVDDLLVVRLLDGRVVRGELDGQTDDERLWLSASDPGIRLSSAFEWSEIESILREREMLTKNEVLKLASAIRAKTTPESQLEQRIAFWFPKRENEDPALADVNFRASRAGRRVAFLEIEAHPVNWDRDAERDGLLVYVRPLDDDGRIVPVNGQIRLQLFGERFAQQTQRTFDASILFPQLGTWTQRLRVEDFGSDGAAIRLPYRRLHPDFNSDLAAHALLTARLGIAGQGTFDDSTADVFIRPASRYRDELFQRSPSHGRFRREESPRRR
ncbi:MAG: hypothetical protein WD065_04455 [Planctomycetaceae bacterium]